MNEFLARFLASDYEGYRARKLHGHWVVWDDVSDHVVEFDRRDIEAAKAELEAESYEPNYDALAERAGEAALDHWADHHYAD